MNSNIHKKAVYKTQIKIGSPNIQITHKGGPHPTTNKIICPQMEITTKLKRRVTKD